MSNPLTEARTELVAALTGAGLDVYPIVPGQPGPGMAWIQHGTPWVRPLTLSRSEVALRVTVTAGALGSNPDTADDLEAKLWAIVTALRTAGFSVDQIDQPEVSTDQQRPYASVTLSTTVHVTD